MRHGLVFSCLQYAYFAIKASQVSHLPPAWCRTYHDQAIVMRRRCNPHVVACEQGLPAALDRLSKLVGGVPSLNAWQAAQLTALSTRPPGSSTVVMLTSIFMCVSARPLPNPAPAMPRAPVQSLTAAASEQLSAAARPAAPSPVANNSVHIPMLTPQTAGCQAQQAFAQPQSISAAQVTAWAEGFMECCDLAEMIFQRWSADMHLQSPMHGTTFSTLICRLGLQGLAFRVLAELKVSSCLL